MSRIISVQDLESSAQEYLDHYNSAEENDVEIHPVENEQGEEVTEAPVVRGEVKAITSGVSMLGRRTSVKE